MPEPLLEMTGVTKSFGGNCVLAGVGLSLGAHEVHALVGENGAGKSTLMKILNGVYTMDSGEIRLAGEVLRIQSPHDARRAGISMIFQEQILANELTRAEKQLVEIARALATAARVIVMDEPTAVLSQKESEELFRIIAELKAKGLAIVYISHRMEELERLADRVTVLRDGKLVFTGESDSIDGPGVIRHMVGRDIDELY